MEGPPEDGSWASRYGKTQTAGIGGVPVTVTRRAVGN